MTKSSRVPHPIFWGLALITVGVLFLLREIGVRLLQETGADGPQTGLVWRPDDRLPGPHRLEEVVLAHALQAAQVRESRQRDLGESIRLAV